MTVERLNASLPSMAATGVSLPSHELLQRMQSAVLDQQTLPVDEDQEILPIEDPREAMDRFVRKWFADDFMRTMLFGDEEKLGVKAEEWT